MITPDYFYVIVGGGMAGLQLALRISEDIFFKGKKIAIIEPSEKSLNDKTWCYWESRPGRWDDLIYKQWQHGKFVTTDISKDLDLEPYSYKMLRSIDFYNYARETLDAKNEFSFIKDEVSAIDSVTRTAKGKIDNYTATHFFDSRPPIDYKKDSAASLIYQHFKGIHIKVNENTFDPRKFTMMDYRVKHKQNTCFTYVLPFTATEALIEFTYFTPQLTEETIYDKKLEKYISTILGISEYEILDSEKGVIPMTDYTFTASNTKHITKIGTAGGWVKPSTGYSFKSTEKKVERVIENIKAGKRPSHKLLNLKYQRYDAIFLDVLEKRNDLGESLFTKLYTKNNIQDIFKFLDEETSSSEDLRIMLSLYHPQFLRSLLNKL
ncbi:lycopene cyclase family protein [Christiangramia aquimixticola]|uniref:lycopene cyclase family protein n=1 Tax=Christiangramia aquimixticola TaxID=1697558 RepID=UPI003AA8BB4E